MGFFILATVGALSGADPFQAGLKALAGAVGLYVITKMVGKAVVNLLVDAMIRKADDDERGEESGIENNS